ncbi:peroxiredoxin [Massilia sp. H6]|uniref:peroxiredoxin family protein n=1 Tax=Massilia sp. H6 TaxID=2970464 RepID=UPI002169E2B5|nr:redoxin domain-containing protein [Massilia sp. H6]UVW30063.1 redoxin domain-containing protein [Massilia sp. H6]
MMSNTKMRAGAVFPEMQWDAVGGGKVDPMSQSGWRALIIYRGQHCPICKSYLDQLEKLQGQFKDTGVAVFAVSADTQEKAEKQAAECGWTFPIGYGLSIPQMRELGLYVSDPRSPEETDRQFSEPALFVINPQNEAQIIDVSNAPFARPDLESLLKGLQFIIGKSYPIRGTA